jgi:hypothetical protein
MMKHDIRDPVTLSDVRWRLQRYLMRAENDNTFTDIAVCVILRKCIELIINAQDKEND